MYRRLAVILAPALDAGAAPLRGRRSLHSVLSLRSPEVSDPSLAVVRDEIDDLRSLVPFSLSPQPPEKSRGEVSGYDRRMEVEIVHPWPEWVKMMELLLKSGYLDRDVLRGRAGAGDDDANRFDISILSSGKDSNTIRTAFLNFARDRPSVIRYLSRWDIQIIVKCGCPSIDRKVVNSAKRLRAHVGLQEGNVCSSCSLRGTCERAFVKARDDEIGRTVDVMRILLTYGLDVITGLVENPACTNKSVKESVKKLLNEVVEYSSEEIDHSLQTMSSIRSLPRDEKTTRSQLFKGQIAVPMKQGDWICPKCNFFNFTKNIKCLRCSGSFKERIQKLREDQEHLPLKKGDWICEKCNFLNFAKNIKCLQCHEKPSNRQLNPGEWECPSCNYVNFQKNVVCLKCNWKRPKSIHSDHKQHGSPGSKKIGFSFVRDDNTHAKNLLKVDKELDDWDSEDEDIVDDDLDGNFRAWKNFAELKNFPILGGKGAVSQDPLVRERWKEEISRQSRGFKNETDSNYSHCSLNSPSILGDLDESDEDDDIVEWFGGRKSNSDLCK